MEKRWLSLYVENRVGVLARIAGLFSGKSYNLQSLTVGTTEDETVSRMTISVESDDATFEQIKKQLNRSVEVINSILIESVRTEAKNNSILKVFKKRFSSIEVVRGGSVAIDSISMQDR